MAFTETFEYKLEIIPPYSIIQCRRADIISKDGTEVARSFHRSVYYPGDDISEAPQEVQDVAGVLWTTAVIESYKNYKEGIQSARNTTETAPEAA